MKVGPSILCFNKTSRWPDACLCLRISEVHICTSISLWVRTSICSSTGQDIPGVMPNSCNPPPSSANGRWFPFVSQALPPHPRYKKYSRQVQLWYWNQVQSSWRFTLSQSPYYYSMYDNWTSAFILVLIIILIFQDLQEAVLLAPIPLNSVIPGIKFTTLIRNQYPAWF